MANSRERLRATFEQVAEAYDRARPSYPPELFDDLADLTGLRSGSRVLEIGCGTGKATVALAQRGYAVTCVELGERLAGVARAKVGPYPLVEVVHAPFETWEPTEAGFDAVVAFTAWHWLDPEVRYSKAARLLASGGSLAVVATEHVLPEGGDRFFVEVQQDYVDLRATREWAGGPPSAPDEVPDLSAEIEATGLFGEVSVRRYVWDVVYATEEYIAVLDTYSGHRELDSSVRVELYDRIRRRIEGSVRKTYLATLNVAHPSG